MYAFPLAQPREVKPITSFKTHPVRFLSMSDGGTLCYSYDGEIYTQQPDATPKKVAIELVRDDRPQFANLQSSDGATSAVVSPDGKQIAFTLRGEVFVTSADYATTKQVTHTPAREAGLLCDGQPHPGLRQRARRQLAALPCQDSPQGRP